MKHTNEICRQCGSRQPGLFYERDLLDDTDINRIRICKLCKSEFFVYDDFELENDAKMIKDRFAKCYKRLGISEKQAKLMAMKMFVNQLRL